MQKSDLFRCIKCKSKILFLENIQYSKNFIKCISCDKEYKINKGVCSFLDDSTSYADSFGFQWNKFAKTQLDSYTGIPLSKNRFFQTTGWKESLEGLNILEAGSGAGRFTEILASTGARIYSFDLSSAVHANFSNNGGGENITIFQASIYEIPLEINSFDKVICLGVLQHTPDPRKSFKSIASFVKPGGEICVDVYANRYRSMLSWKYFLRPLTKKIDNQVLFNLVSKVVNFVLPISIFLRKIAGKFGARLLPIVEYSHLIKDYQLNKQWAILDTFDMYSPAHDHPCSIQTLKSWFMEEGFVNIHVAYGPNGIIGRGIRPR